ncbi:MAG: glycosyltransferase family 9 protein, partial [Planctomycetia bacterium]
MDALPHLRPAPLSTYQARRICIIKPSSLGDVVQALPVLAALRSRFPRAAISWVVNRSYASLLTPIGLLDDVIEFDRDWFHGSKLRAVRMTLDFLRQLRRRRFDVAVDLQGLLRSGVMCWGTNAKHRIGLASAREGAGFFYTDLVNDLPREQGAVNRYWRVAEYFGAGDAERRFPLDLTDDERRSAAELLAGLPRPIVGVGPGARWTTKRWPPAHFAAAIRGALAGRGGSAVLVGAPDERGVAQEVADAVDVPVRNLAGATNLRQLAAVLEAVDLFLTNDSG